MFKHFLAMIALLLCLSFISSPKVFALGALCEDCAERMRDEDGDLWHESQLNFDRYIDREFRRVERFIIHEMWEQNMLPVMMQAATEFTTIAMQQAMTVGMFIDAESQMTAQRLLQELQAKTHKRYHPSIGMCEFGSVSKSLGATEIRSEAFAVLMSKRSIDRQMGMGNSAAAQGGDLDKETRIRQFTTLFCNEKDRASATAANTLTSLGSVCSEVAWDDSDFDAIARSRINKDIDYFSLLESPWTLSIDFTNREILDADATPPVRNEDEEHIMALNSNLFGHNLFPRMPPAAIINKPNEPISPAQQTFMDMRALIAKRSVAENSLYAIASMKAEGYRPEDPSASGDFLPPSARPFMAHVMEDLGVPEDEVTTLFGENPSYFAQMEVLTKKLYQHPDFYTNLYDKPANVERKTVALQAVKLMQKFDMLKSALRDEATVSVLLEMAVIDLQNEVEDEMKAIGLTE